MASALEGIRVLDLCIVLAGPTCGRTLAEYGAEIIKVDVWHRPPGVKTIPDVQRGKRSICIDITSPEGLDIFYRLVDTADVVLGGFRKGVTERLGIGYEQVKQRKPDIIYLSINAFGQDGPWANRPGYEQNAQAATGVQIRNGGRESKPIHSPYTFNDYGTGLMGAYAVMMAVLERKRTGKGQHVHTSLAQSGSTYSSPYLIDYEGYQRNEIEGLDARGYHALSRLYQTSDGWMFLVDADWKALSSISDFSSLKATPANDQLLSDELSETFRAKATQEWIDILEKAGIIAVKNATMDDILLDEYPRQQNLIVTEDVPNYGRVQHGGIAPQLSKTPVQLGRTPVFAEETEAVLLELGLSVEEIDALRDKDIIPPLE